MLWALLLALLLALPLLFEASFDVVAARAQVAEAEDILRKALLYLRLCFVKALRKLCLLKALVTKGSAYLKL